MQSRALAVSFPPQARSLTVHARLRSFFSVRRAPSAVRRSTSCVAILTRSSLSPWQPERVPTSLWALPGSSPLSVTSPLPRSPSGRRLPPTHCLLAARSRSAARPWTPLPAFPRPTVSSTPSWASLACVPATMRFRAAMSWPLRTRSPSSWPATSSCPWRVPVSSSRLTPSTLPFSSAFWATTPGRPSASGLPPLVGLSSGKRARSCFTSTPGRRSTTPTGRWAPRSRPIPPRS